MYLLRHVIITFFTLCYCCLALAQELPDLGSHSEFVLPALQEQKMGKEFMRAVYRSQPVIMDPLVNDYLNQIGNRLASHSRTQIKPFHFFMISNKRINAFAGPGGYIGVNSGLIIATETESQLAAVLAHEISHVTQHHLVEKIEANRNLNIAAMGAVIAAVLIGSQTNAHVAAGAVQASIGTARAQGLTYSRTFEQEADRIGMQTLYKSNFDPEGMPQFFDRMQRLNFSQNSALPEWASTHPLTDNRIADTQNRAEQYPKRNYDSSLMYYLMRERVRVLTTSATSLLNYYRANLTNPNAKIAAANQYGYSLALLKNNRFPAAEEQINDLIKQYPNKVLYQMALAEILLEKRDNKMALAILETALKNKPQYYPLIVQYGDALVQSEQYSTAATWLKPQLRRYPENIPLTQLYADANGRSGNLVTAYEARAALYVWLGENDLARIQLQQALTVPNITEFDRSIISAKLETLIAPSKAHVLPSSFSP